MIYSLIFVLISGALASKPYFQCEESILCRKGSRHCEEANGKQWCCPKNRVFCDSETNKCHPLVSNVPLVLLRPSIKKSEYFTALEKLSLNIEADPFRNKQILSRSLNYLCQPLETSKKYPKPSPVNSTQCLSNRKTGDGSTDIYCPGRKQRCPPENTCCLIGKDVYGCCRYQDAVCCDDLIHCCPPDTMCNTETMECISRKDVLRKKIRP
ncbi:granulin [Nephila pilipes]|uniref:Granulin n=1 Tax=Nephila pilipes TaxID=299642 RepID=A0A8X6PWF4_NEPPI|nr:granulin [Nephila pilipes]